MNRMDVVVAALFTVTMVALAVLTILDRTSQP